VLHGAGGPRRAINSASPGPARRRLAGY
jgi:hypothetical protein